MIINTDRNFVFLAHAHTASRAVSDALAKLSGSEFVFPHHAPISLIQDKFRHVDFDKMLKFTTVRHPGDWIVTRWLCRGGRHIDFSPFIREQKRHIFYRYLGQADTVVHYENLEFEVSDLLGIPIKLDRNPEHVTKDKADWQSYWSREDAEWANNYFEDFTRYAYDLIPV
jgi:hypothetical protein